MQEFLAAAQEAARLGGAILQDWARRFTTREKSPANLVTEADLASQTAIAEYLQQRFPQHHLVGEEDLQVNRGDSEFRWFIDPLDGTGNYVHGFPYYAVSIGLEVAGELAVGAIYDPTRDEMFSAARGAGAHLNGQPIHVSETAQLSAALCMASLPPRADRDHLAVRRFLCALSRGQSVQRSGSAALNLCSVACGRVDAFWSNSLYAWDMAAGVVLVREAGGQVTTTGGGPFHVLQADLLATNGTALHAEVVELLRLPD
jgi:myo-inositol-1(or 4)-monophosphatase